MEKKILNSEYYEEILNESDEVHTELSNMMLDNIMAEHGSDNYFTEVQMEMGCGGNCANGTCITSECGGCHDHTECECQKIELERNECQHVWKSYKGAIEAYEYCERCNEKRDIRNP